MRIQAPPAAAIEEEPDEGYDIDALLSELDGEGFTPVEENAPEYLDLGGGAAPPTEPVAPVDDFASFQQSMAAPPSGEPAGGDELDALLGDFGSGGAKKQETPEPQLPPAEPAAGQDDLGSLDDLLGDLGGQAAAPQEPAPASSADLDSLLEADTPVEAGGELDDLLSEPEAVPAAQPPAGDDDMAAFLQELEASDAVSPQSTGEMDSMPGEELFAEMEGAPGGEDLSFEGLEEAGAPLGEDLGDEFGEDLSFPEAGGEGLGSEDPGPVG